MSVGSFSLTFQLHILPVGNTDVIQWGVDFTEVMEIKNKKQKEKNGRRGCGTLRIICSDGLNAGFIRRMLLLYFFYPKISFVLGLKMSAI